MLIPTDAAFAAAVDAQERTPIHSLGVRWVAGQPTEQLRSHLKAVAVDRQATGDLPDEVSTVEGFVSAQLSATLGGERDDGEAIDRLAPYRDDSPLYRTPRVGSQVGYAMAFQEAGNAVALFVGTIRSLRPSSRSREVELSALDTFDLLRAPITLPSWGIERESAVARNHGAYGINTQWVVDYVLRRNSIYASPPARPDAQVSVTGHGSLVAEVGQTMPLLGTSMIGATSTGFLNGGSGGPHPFGMLYVRNGSGYSTTSHTITSDYLAREAFRPKTGAGLGIAFWMALGTGTTASPDYRRFCAIQPLTDNGWYFQVEVSRDGKLRVSIVTNGSRTCEVVRTNTAAYSWQYVGVHWQFRPGNTVRVTTYVNGVQQQNDFTRPSVSVSTRDRARLTVEQPLPWSNTQMWFAYGWPTTWPGASHTSQVGTIGTGLNKLTYLPDVVEQDSAEVIKEAVGAEFGLVGFNEEGRFSFTPRDRALDPTVVDKEVTASRALLDLATEVNIDTVRNVVSSETTAGYLVPGVVVSAAAKEEFDTPVGVFHYDVPIEHGSMPYTELTVPRYTTAQWNDGVTNGFVATRADNAAVEVAAGAVRVTCEAVASRTARVVVRNYSPSTIRFATTQGNPALRVQGRVLRMSPPVVDRLTADGSIGVYGERTYKVPASKWRQLAGSVRPVASGLLGQLAAPLPVVAQVPIVGDPRVQVGDCVRFVDPEGQGSFRAYVASVKHAMSGGKFTTTLGVRPVAPPGMGLVHDPELGVVGSTLIAAP